MSSSILFIFDIDGTLIKSGRMGMNTLGKALIQNGCDPVIFENMSFAGRTDLSIIKECLKFCGIPSSQSYVDAVISQYLENLEQPLSEEDYCHVLPGVFKWLHYIQDKNAALALGTGNIRQSAHYKLLPNNLYAFFPIGGYGCDHEDRKSVIATAIMRSTQYYQYHFKPENIWVVGDTLNDINAARDNHVRVIAVATGFSTYESLHQHAPDILCRNLEHDFFQLEKILG